jgi:uncharacterized RDD family membrane protein YckC
LTRGAPSAPPDARGGPRPNAPLARRCAALGYEALLLAGIALIAGFLTVPLVATSADHGFGPAVPALAGRILSGGVVFVVAGSYFTWSWTGGRRTLPMKTWHIAMACVDGGPVRGRTAVVRYFAAWIGPSMALAAYVLLKTAELGAHATWLLALNFLWAIVDPDRQFLHDRIAGTRIVLGR